MTIFQVIATLFALFMMYVVRIHGQKKTLGPIELSVWYSVWIVFIIISIFPNLLLGIVGVLHFSRVFDLLLVMALMVLTVVIFLSYFAQKAAIKKLERFVSLQAVLETEERLKSRDSLSANKVTSKK
jgi:hypothetical protein